MLNIYSMPSAQFYIGGEPSAIKPTASKRAFSLLAQPKTPCNEAWLLARAGINSNGPLVVRLVDDLGRAVSGDVETNSSEATRLKFLNVKIPASDFPPLIRVQAVNKSTEDRSDAYVDGVLLVY